MRDHRNLPNVPFSLTSWVLCLLLGAVHSGATESHGPFGCVSGGSGAASATAGATTATAVVSILAGPAGLAEGASGVVQVGVDRPMDVDAVVAIQADAGLAVEPESLVFGPGRAATRQVTVTAVDDAIDAGDRTLGIRLVPGDDLTSGDPVAWPIAVADNDLPAVSVQVAARVVESATVVPVVVRIDRISLRPVVVTLTLGGTADDADVSVSATQAVIAPGMTETVLWLTVAADDAVEPSETVAVLAEVVSGAQPQGASGLLRILTDDLPAPVVAYQERTASADGTLTVRWYVALPADSDVGTLQITGLPAGSTAVEMLDGVAVVRIQGRSTDLAGQMASVSFSASGGTGPSASVTVQGGSGSDGDRNQVPLPPPTIGALTITAGLTGDRHGAFPGVGDPEAYFTNKTQVSFSVPVSVSFGTLGPVEVRLDGPSPQVVQGDSGTVQVPAEGLYTLTVTATAVDGERRAVGSGTPVVLVVDRTGPVVAVSATAPLRTALEGDRDLLFVNGMDPGINDENRSWGLNCLAPSEVVRFLGFSASDGLSGISRTAGGQVDTDRIRAQARDNYWRAQDPGKVHDVPVDVPDPAAADPVQIRVTEVVLPASADDDGWKLTAIPHSRYKIALKVQDRCGNYARSKQADPRLAASDETGGNDADAAPGQGYRDQFKVWVDTRPPEVDVARLPYQQWDPEVVPWNEQKTHRIFDLTRLRMARAGWDAAYVWRDAPSESTLARRVQRGPTDLPDLA
ncbi:MAG: hypothetical protein RLZZ127_3332, partial [Planctomycetota bacterium]